MTACKYLKSPHSYTVPTLLCLANRTWIGIQWLDTPYYKKWKVALCSSKPCHLPSGDEVCSPDSSSQAGLEPAISLVKNGCHRLLYLNTQCLGRTNLKPYSTCWNWVSLEQVGHRGWDLRVYSPALLPVLFLPPECSHGVSSQHPAPVTMLLLPACLFLSHHHALYLSGTVSQNKPFLL